ncbi:MAG: S41 family peptidase [Bryobacteraceae bacterium]
MNRRFQFAVVASSTCLVLLLLFGAVHGRGASTDGPYNHLAVYSEVLSRINDQYVEQPDMKAVTLGAINGMLESIDPYASYLNADQYKEYLAAKGTVKAGVGIVLSRRFGYLTVVDTLPGAPAAKAGLGTGDVIESINNVSTRDMPLAYSEMLIEGAPNSTVELSVLRARRAEPQKITLTRVNIAYPAVSEKLVTGQGPDPIGVIQSYTLTPERVDEIGNDIKSLQQQGAKRLILDLRHCSTGDPKTGAALANLFLDNGLMTYSQGQKVSRENYEAVASKDVTKLPLAVIVDRGTAGPSEIAAAALMGRRADVVGEHTFGDAAIQSAVKLDDGSAVILSVAKFYSPDGKAIQDTGVTPNVMQAEPQPAVDSPDPDDQLIDTEPVAKPGVDDLMNRAIKVVDAK